VSGEAYCPYDGGPCDPTKVVSRGGHWRSQTAPTSPASFALRSHPTPEATSSFSMASAKKH